MEILARELQTPEARMTRRNGMGRGRDIDISSVADWADGAGLAVTMGELQNYYRLAPDAPHHDEIAAVLVRNQGGQPIRVWIDPVRLRILDADDAPELQGRRKNVRTESEAKRGAALWDRYVRWV